MTTNLTASADHAVHQYLDAVDRRLGGLPLLERRELINDLATHIAAVRAEEGAHDEGRVLDILERLGSPDVVAAAAYAEAGPSGAFPLPPVGPPRGARPAPRANTTWVPIVVILALVSFLLLVAVLLGLVFFARASGTEAPAVAPPGIEQPIPEPPAPDPFPTN